MLHQNSSPSDQGAGPAQKSKWLTLRDGYVDKMADILIAHRKVLLGIALLLTVTFGYTATGVKLDPGFNKMIPLNHPYMATFLEYVQDFSGANRVLVNLRWKGEGDIYNKEFMEALNKATNEVFFIPGVDRPKLTSLFTPNVRYIEITEYGFTGDVVVPSRYSGSPQDLAKIRNNVAAAGQIGRLVTNDQKGALIRADLQENDPTTGERLQYADVAERLEALRTKFSSDKIEVNIIGFAKVVGDVEDALFSVISFFALAFLITALLLFIYSRSLKLTVVALIVALIPVVWLLGILPLIGMGIDPMSILVPFLIFSIGISHAVQMTNAWKQEVIAGAASIDASHAAFRKLFIPGAVALTTNALGFLVIMHIDIAIVRELGVTACIGVSLMIATNKIILPIILSHLKLEQTATKPSTFDEPVRHPLWWAVSGASKPGLALGVIAAALALVVFGAFEARGLKTGDIGDGVPELRADSRYNKDNATIVGGYDIGVDVLTVTLEAKSDNESCLNPAVMNALGRFEYFARGIHGVQSVLGVASTARIAISANNEGNPRWSAIPKSSQALQQGNVAYNPDLGLVTNRCQAIQTLIFTESHEGAVVAHIVEELKHYIDENPTEGVKFRLAGGNVGVMAATNEAVEDAEVTMLLSIFGAIGLLCMLEFRSIKATLCIIVPLSAVSILCNALMAHLGIGLKVATLPVIALGVGVGVDYGIYLFERIQHHMNADGQDFRHAFYEALRQRGTAAVFTAATMSIGVGTWAFSPLQFQADMGILLAFMFLVNVFGAILLLPALATWLGCKAK